MCSSETKTPTPPTDATATKKKPAETCPESVTLTMITPAGDPVNSPNSTQGADGQNEYTFNTANPGVLTMNLKAKVSPSGCAASIKDKVQFQVTPIGDSRIEWDPANKDGKPTVNGNFLEATVKFIGLPGKNSDFGSKVAKLLRDGKVNQTATYEVFFSRDAKNHPNAGKGTTPNWFYYWGQVASFAHVSYAGASGGPTMAKVTGMTGWSYTAVPDKTTLHIYDEVVTKVKAYGVGKSVSGIDNFISTLNHESRHVDQISRADGLLPSVRCWRYGWSWNQRSHNHWGPGPDGRYGSPPSVTQTAVKEIPPFEPGGGDDVDLSDIRWANWPASWPWPSPLLVSSPTETDAIRHADSIVDEDQYADEDWGDPGKNHKTLLRYDD